MSRRDLLIFALGVIKDECCNHPNCINCPLWNNRELHCEIQKEVPNAWYVPDLFDSSETIEPIF